MCKWIKTYSSIFGNHEFETIDAQEGKAWINAHRTVSENYAPTCILGEREKIVNHNHKYCQFCGTKIDLE